MFNEGETAKDGMGGMNGKPALMVMVSYHHKNTEKVAMVMAKVLNAVMSSPHELNVTDLGRYRLIGFGSGIYDGMHHRSLLEFAEKLPTMNGTKVFLFSTSAIMGRRKVAGDHSRLRDILQKKGCVVVDEFACKGFNTNSFLKHIGGMNKGRPNDEDLARAKAFARGVTSRLLRYDDL